MKCGYSRMKIFFVLLVLSLFIIVYKYQKNSEVSPSKWCMERIQKIHRDKSSANGFFSLEMDNSDDIGKVDVTRNLSSSGTFLDLTSGKLEIGRNFIFIDPPGDFLSRIEVFNTAITKLRHSIQAKRNDKPWQGLEEPLDVLWCNRDDFMEFLKYCYPHVKTVQLKWRNDGDRLSWSSLHDRGNILIKSYYSWSASETLCKWIQTPGFTKGRWDAVYNRTCSTDMSLSSVKTSLEPVYFHGKPIYPKAYWPNDGFSYPEYFYNSYPDFLLYMHIVEDAVVLKTGDIMSKNLKLVPYTCSHLKESQPPWSYYLYWSPIYSEVFVASQFWGTGFFHMMIEGFPRLAPYMKFLLDNPSVRIHVVEAKPYMKDTLRFLGINPERLISNIVRAKVLYVPQATPCGFAQVHTLQLLNHLYTTKLHQIHGSTSVENSTVIFIRRSGRRKFQLNREVEQTVEKAAKDFNRRFVVFRDDPSPSMEEAMALFYSAVLVVAPHGAGLSNVVYSRPGTYVIEGVCNEPHVNMCYQRTSHLLGHRYHAIPSRQGCEDIIDIEPAVVDIPVRTYLQLIKDSQEKQ